MRRMIFLALLVVLLPTPVSAEEGVDALRLELEALTQVLSTRIKLLLIYEEAGKKEEASECRRKIRETMDAHRAALDALAREIAAAQKAQMQAERAKQTPPDPVREIIEQYATGETKLSDFEQVTSIVMDPKESAAHREMACHALRRRFRDFGRSEPGGAHIMKEIGRALLARLNDKDQALRGSIAAVFRDFWPGAYAQIGYEPDDGNYRSRYKAWKAWREFLSN